MPRTEHFAVVVGINRYPELHDLNLEGPVHDAQAFAQWLQDPAGGGLPAENLRLLVTEPPQGAAVGTHPKVEEIDVLFKPLYEIGQEARVGERLYIFVSGHGMADSLDLRSAALMSADASPQRLLHVAMVKRAEWFRRHGAFDEIVLFSDCCRDNLGFELDGLPWPERRANGPAHPRAAQIRYLYGFGAGYGRQARERDFGDGIVYGIFSRSLLKALAEALPDAMGRVTGRRLQDHVHNIQQSVAGPVDVGPPDFDSGGVGEIVFADVSEATTHPVLVRVHPHTGRETLVVTQGPSPVDSRVSAAARETLHLQPGLYKLAIAGTSRSTLIEVPQTHECHL